MRTQKSRKIFLLCLKAKEEAEKKQWKKAFDICNYVFSKFTEQTDLYDKFLFAKTAFELNKLYLAKKISWNLYKLAPDYEANISLLADILFKITENEANISNVVNILNRIHFILKLELSPYKKNKIIILTAKLLLKKNSPQEALKLLNECDIKNLSNKILKNSKGKTIPSQREQCFLLKVKLLIINQLYNEAISFAESLLREEKISKNNKIWITLYKADASYALKKYKQALNEYFRILEQKKFWFVYFRIAKTIYQMKEEKIALFYAIKAALDRSQKTWFKITIFKFIIDRFTKFLSENQSKNIAKLILNCYLKNGFTHNAYVHKIQKKFDLNNKENVNLKKLENKVYASLKKIFYGKQYQGEIIYLAKNYGFIEYKKQKIFFHFSEVKFNKNLLKKNLKVKFYLTYSYDRKKEKFTFQANSLKLQ